MTYMLRAMLALAALAGAAAPASAQIMPAPPQVPLWRLEANGDAVQTDLGFVLPAPFRDFERAGFTSTRDDGASVAAHYRRAEGPLRMRILIQLRGDVRGFPVPGADGLERNWRFVQSVADNEYGTDSTQGPPDELADQRLVWGDARQPNARMRLRRYRLTGGGAEVQGVWARTIGLWAVIVTVAGPEASRADIEAAGRAVTSEIQWPGAPVSAELRAILPAWLPALRACPSGLGRDGDGRAADPGPVVAMMIGMGLSSYFTGNPAALPHPVTHPQDYCLIERFRIGQAEISALGWTGDLSAYPAVRYAFLIGGSGVMMQYESFFTLPPAEGGPAGTTRLVWLTASNERRVAALRVFTDWPSYAEAKRIVSESGGPQPRPVVEVTHPPGQIRITPINTGPLPPGQQGPAPTP